METVVVGVDGSEPSRAALKHAAESHPEATVHAVHVPEATTEDLGTSGGAEGESERRGRLILDEAAEEVVRRAPCPVTVVR